jgi:hypothetical protein
MLSPDARSGRNAPWPEEGLFDLFLVCDGQLGHTYRSIVWTGSRTEKHLQPRSSDVLHRLNSSLRRLVWPRLTGISVCFLSFMRS